MGRSWSTWRMHRENIRTAEGSQVGIQTQDLLAKRQHLYTFHPTFMIIIKEPFHTDRTHKTNCSNAVVFLWVSVVLSVNLRMHVPCHMYIYLFWCMSLIEFMNILLSSIKNLSLCLWINLKFIDLALIASLIGSAFVWSLDYMNSSKRTNSHVFLTLSKELKTMFLMDDVKLILLCCFS